MANRRFVVSSGQIDENYKEDECLEPVSPEEARTGDVGLYTNKSGIVQHLEIFINDEKVTSKRGVSTDRSPQLPGQSTHFSSVATYSIVRKTQPDTITKKVKPSKDKGLINVVSNKQFEKIKKEVRDSQQRP